VCPIISDLVGSIVPKSEDAFIQQILAEVVNSSVTENTSFVSNLSCSSKRKAGLSQFLNEVPLDLIEKRRSTRAKGTPASGGVSERGPMGTSGENTASSPRGAELTAKQFLQQSFPSSLLTLNHVHKMVDLTLSPEKKSDITNSTAALNSTGEKPSTSITAGEEAGLSKPQEWLSEEEEREFVEEFTQKFCCSSRLMFLSQLEEFLAIVVENFHTRSWPENFSKMYLKCYVKWRKHQHFPDEFIPQDPHRFIPVIITANEILLQAILDENAKVKNHHSKTEILLILSVVSSYNSSEYIMLIIVSDLEYYH